MTFLLSNQGLLFDREIIPDLAVFLMPLNTGIKPERFSGKCALFADIERIRAVILQKFLAAIRISEDESVFRRKLRIVVAVGKEYVFGFSQFCDALRILIQRRIPRIPR